MSGPAVLVTALGGTIAMTPGSSGGVEPSLSAASLVAAVPALSEVASVTATTFRQVPGAHLTLDDVIALAGDLAARDGFDGHVVTQGTDTIEETAFGLDVLWRSSTPLVVTGAMRHPGLAGADGPANLLAAVTVAGSRSARDQGCLVVMNDEIHAARFVRKRHASSPAAFGSPLTGPVGSVTEGRCRLWTSPPPGPGLPSSPGPSRGGVALVTLALGDDGSLLREVDRLGYAGVVVEAFGGGHVTRAAAEVLVALAARIPVVLASRTDAGEVLTGTYAFPGSERDLLSGGLVPAGMLDGPKARLLLDLLLRAGASRHEIATALASDAWAVGAARGG